MKQACHGPDALRAPESSLGVIPVIPRTKYTFHGSTAGVPPPPSIIPLRTRIDTSEWTSGVLIVRLHAKSFPSATSAAEVEVYNDAFTPEDPAQTFVESLLRGIATIPNGAAVGTLYAVDLVQPFASMVRVQLKFYQGTSTSGVSSLTLSAELVGRKRMKPKGPPLPETHHVSVHALRSRRVGERRVAIELRTPDGTRDDWMTVVVPARESDPRRR